MSLNPLKRVKFISIYPECVDAKSNLSLSQSPQTGQVYFNIRSPSPKFTSPLGLNPLKRVKFISIIMWYATVIMGSSEVSIPSNGSSLFQFQCRQKMNKSMLYSSQSPQTGQVYFNAYVRDLSVDEVRERLNPLKRVKFISI